MEVIRPKRSRSVEKIILYQTPEDIDHLLSAPVRHSEKPDEAAVNHYEADEIFNITIKSFPKIVDEEKDYGPEQITCGY